MRLGVLGGLGGLRFVFVFIRKVGYRYVYFYRYIGLCYVFLSIFWYSFSVVGGYVYFYWRFGCGENG